MGISILGINVWCVVFTRLLLKKFKPLRKVKGKGEHPRYELETHNMPEIKLLIAVVERALFDLYHPNSAIRGNAVDWLLGKTGGKFSFTYCCEMCGFSDGAIELIQSYAIHVETS